MDSPLTTPRVLMYNVPPTSILPHVGEEAGGPRGPLRGRPKEAPCEEEAGRETLDAA